ncbi:Solute carrier 41 member 1 [Clonorchis sinensis]|uniref:Solute carrier 41 member 1 n=1 Tax=Clonorchis sinensis TaxID=79923 RepID=A0A8T1MNX2_CLOSI|nr:Solute carrier 41 member 1 [Clonorchis sinensis]
MDTGSPRLREIVPACLFAGMGMVFAGTYLDKVKRTQAEQFDPQLLAIIPPLIGLKGNLEVTLSSRLATLANIKTEVNRQAIQMFFSTLAYILMQGVSAAIVISTLCVVMYSPTEYKFANLLHLTAVSVITCTLALCTLSFLVFALIVCCMYLGTDPDNVAPPMAAAFGDLGTVTLLLWANYYSSEFPDGAQILALVILLAVFFFGPFLLRCDETMNTPTELRGLLINRNTLMGSITPLLGAVLMSSLSGQVLAHFDQRLKNLARLQIAINGVGGCFGSIVVSRMITRIHAARKRPLSPPWSRKPSNEVDQNQHEHCTSPECSSDVPQSETNSSPFLSSLLCNCRHFISTEHDHSIANSQRQLELDVESDSRRASRLILFCCLPIHLILAMVSLMLHEVLESEDGHATLPLSTIVAYLSAGFLQVFIVLHFATWIVVTCWRHLTSPRSGASCLCAPRTMDPHPSLASLDLAAIALTTGLGDLIGSILLATSMHLSQTMLH